MIKQYEKPKAVEIVTLNPSPTAETPYEVIPVNLIKYNPSGIVYTVDERPEKFFMPYTSVYCIREPLVVTDEN